MINAALNILPGAVGQGRPQIIPATVAPNTAQTPQPTGFNDPLFVVSPIDNSSFWKVLDWPADHGGTLPRPGAACALFYDSNGILRCAWWDGQYTPPQTLAGLGIARGTGTLTWPGSSAFSNTVTVAHTLAGTPTAAVGLTQLFGGGSSINLHWVTIDGTNVSWRGHTDDGTSPTNTTTTAFTWIAIL